jgi:hypothetical protein
MHCSCGERSTHASAAPRAGRHAVVWRGTTRYRECDGLSNASVHPIFAQIASCTFTCACGVAHMCMNTCGVEYGCGLGGELHGCTLHGSADHSRVPLLELGSMGCALRRDVMCPPCCAETCCDIADWWTLQYVSKLGLAAPTDDIMDVLRRLASLRVRHSLTHSLSGTANHRRPHYLAPSH